MRKQFYFHKAKFLALHTILVYFLMINITIGQCVPTSGAVEGYIYYDSNNDGIWDEFEEPIANSALKAYNEKGEVLKEVFTDNLGHYYVDGLEDGEKIKIIFDLPDGKVPAFEGKDNGTILQFATVPQCGISFGMLNANGCHDNTIIMLSCFVQGPTTQNTMAETIVSVPYEFNSASHVGKVSTHGETGSVWGLSWHPWQQKLYAASYIKQNSGLTSHGHDAIYVADMSQNPIKTDFFTSLKDVGVYAAPLVTTNPMDCAYGAQVGKFGLGSMQMSDDFQSLYVVNISEKELVKINIENPVPETTLTWKIPDPGCSNGEYYPFATEFYNGDMYIGVTCSAETSKKEADSYAHIYKFDEKTGDFDLIFSTNYIKGYWIDFPASNTATSHWLTDIDFTDEGNMVMAMTDRIGHRYCKPPTSRLDRQKPDILLAWNDNGIWKLEDNAQVGTLTGANPNNGEGPGGGEFFDDNWIGNPITDPETTIGSMFVLRDRNSVVAAAYDPLHQTYSGGLLRFNTQTGKKIEGIELYQSDITTLFGKATGFGEIMATCVPPSIQIGNLVWIDTNKNGLQDSDEPGACDFVINLYDEDLNLLEQTNTDEKGQYIFTNLIPLKTYFIGIDESNFVPGTDYMVNKGDYYEFTINVDNDNDSSLDNSDINFEGLKATDYLVEIFTLSTNHNFDIGLILNERYDLALTNEYIGGNCTKMDDIIPFKISVYNQGNVADFSYSIVAYLTDNYEFIPELNTEWQLDGDKVFRKVNGGIEIDESDDFYLNLKIKEGNAQNYIIYSEISKFLDNEGNPVEDFDSTPDSIKDNDAGGVWESDTDDIINGDRIFDEDDQDPAAPYIFDLALKYEVVDYDPNMTVGSQLNTMITIYNQGLVPSVHYQLIVYMPSGLDFDESANVGWTENNGKLYFDNYKPIPSNYFEEHYITFTINEQADKNMVWYAEIMSQQSEVTVCDFDSTPDDIMTNDKGGEPNTGTDDLVTDDGTIDEDDQDPITLQVNRLDLALIKYALKTKVKAGEEVTYYIEIYNQGDVTVEKVRIVDYLATETYLKDSEWEMMGNDIASRMLTFPNGLKSGEKAVTTINVIVDENPVNHVFENIAEIAEIYDMSGFDISDNDIDSKSDMDRDNDAGGKSNTSTDNEINASKDIDEDDHDPAMLKMIESEITNTQCLNETATADSGFFVEDILIKGPPSENWRVLQVSGLYQFPLSITPILISVDTPLFEAVSDPDNTGYYSIQGAYKAGEVYTIRFINDAGDTEEISGGGKEFLSIALNGPTSVCGSESEPNALIQTYSLSQDIPGATYIWDADGGGTVNGTGSEVDIVWYGIAGSYEVTVAIDAPDTCYYLAPLNVEVGLGEGAMSCISNLQLSLGAACSVTVTPQMLSSTTITLGAPYSVMLTDAYGNPIPNATLTSEHVGTNVMAKLVESCSGNSCWTTIKVQDKMAPTIICEDLSLPCYKKDEFFGPIVTDNCGGVVQMILLNSTITTAYCQPYTAQITKEYQAVDQYGNKSEVCQIVMSLDRINPSLINWPIDLLKDINNLTCGGYETDGFGNPSSAVTGVPTIDGIDMYPSFESLCLAGASYSDRVIEFSGCVTKVMRTWTVVEGWCNGVDPIEHVQTIEIVDTENPSITCPSDITQSTGLHNCEATVTLPLAIGLDDCAKTGVTIDINVIGGQYFINPTTSPKVVFSEGTHMVEYIAIDPCGNEESCIIEVKVEDKTAPQVKGVKFTTLGLTSDGIGYLYASALNNGSTDECGIAFMEIRRSDDLLSCEDDDGFGPKVNFDCSDVNDTIDVDLRVWDLSDNFNCVTVKVIVQDKHGPEIMAPNNITVACDFYYEIDKLDQYFGEAIAIDECGADLIELPYALNIDNCSEGTLTRTWEAKDSNNTVTKQQVITFENFNDFDPHSIDWPEDALDLEGCTGSMFLPNDLPVENTRRPSYDAGACNVVTDTFSDRIFPLTDNNDGGACFKILRTWSVHDDCLNETYNYDQILMITNKVAPIFTKNCDTLLIAENNLNDCNNGMITLTMTAEDVCTNTSMLNWIAKVDTNFTGIFTEDTIFNGKGGTAIASGNYPVGNHRVLWSFEDLCGNVSTCLQPFSIINAEKPIAVCKDTVNIALEFMNMEGVDVEMACLTAESLNASSSHPCDYPIYFSFSDTTKYDTLKCFSCFDIGFNDITLYVHDDFGNIESCNTIVNVQDNNDIGICPTFDLALFKTFNSTESNIQYGDDVVFDIHICNQGSNPIMKVDVIDYIPSGYTFQQTNNLSWSSNGDGNAIISLVANDGILPMTGIDSAACVIVPIKLTLNQVAGIDNYKNYAEILYGEDNFGFTSDMDIDSDAGSNTTAENSVMPGDPNDDNITSDGTNGDQDDHDPAIVPIFDLALTKTLVTQGPYSNGDDLTFNNTIYNQGTVNATNIIITDYIPCGLIFKQNLNTNWTYNALTHTATQTVNLLSAGQAPIIVPIVLTIESCSEEDAYLNYAEISSADGGTDIDSTPNDNPSDDAGGVPNSDTDDTINNENGDEDDQDPALVNIFDLALKKELETDAPYNYGDLLEFKITVCNQGNVDATNVVVRDYLPNGFGFTFANNTGWGGTSGAPIFTIPSLISGACDEISLFLSIEQTDGGEKDWINYAEIQSAVGGIDVDSNPNSNNSTENSVLPDSPEDDDLLSTDKGGEEDDHDPAGVEIYDLALLKGISNSGPFTYGDNVVYNIEVFNQGSITASNIQVTDYIPCGYVYLSSNNANGWSYNSSTGKAIRTINNNLVPGASTIISITLQVQECTIGGINNYLNFAEISLDNGDDIDSTPDDNNLDTYIDGITNNDNGDEDDHDPEDIVVFDLALSKSIDINGPYDFGDIATFNIIVTNQGNTTASNFQIVDYIGCGLKYVDTGNSGWIHDANTDMATYTITGPLAPGVSTSVNINFEVEACGILETFVNNAEIKTNPSGLIDSDSTPDMIFDNEEPGEDDFDDDEIFLGPCNVDNVPPTCSVKDTTIILTDSDFVVIDSSYIDNGSIDDCSPITYSFEPDTLYCTNLGLNLITTTVTDLAGNTSTCTSLVNLEFEFGIECIQDTTISLLSGMQDLNPEDFYLGDNLICGFDVDLSLSKNFIGCNDPNLGMQTLTLTATLNSNPPVTSTCDFTITVVDGTVPTISCADQSYFCNDNYVIIPPTTDDECFPEDVVLTLIDSLISVNQCGIGFKSYTYEASDAAGNSSSCTQVIEITNPSPFTLEDTNVEDLDENITLENCTSTEPEDFEGGGPLIQTNFDNCSNVSISRNDTSTDGCPYTITRVWTVVDSCQMIGTDSLATFYFTQIIDVDDSSAPELFDLPQDTIIELTAMDCEGYVDLSGAFALDCDSELTETNNSIYSDDPNSLDASGIYPVGTTEITLTAEDDCGNSTSHTFTVELVDTVGYTVECIKIFIDIEDTDPPSVSSTPEQSVFGVLNDCLDTLDFSYSGTTPDDDIIVWDCNDLGDQFQFIYWWEGDVLIDSCKNLITILDPNDHCLGSLVDVYGDINTVSGNAIPGVSVNLEGSNLPEQMVNDGKYIFPDMPLGGEYTVSPLKDDNPLEGVSTLDLVMIQRHILSLQKLETTHNLIAADINDDDKISASDLVQLRKLILGVIPTFQQNTSWKMLDNRYQFINPSDPLQEEYATSHYISSLYGNMIIDFTGIKIGDVNGTIDENFRSSGSSNRAASVIMEAHDQYVRKGELVNLNLRLQQDQFFGLQMALESNNYYINNIRQGNIDDAYFHTNIQDAFSRIQIANSIPFDSELTIELQLEMKADGYLSQLFEIAKDFNNEIYDENLNPQKIEIKWIDAEDEDFAISQNTPNPWSFETSIDFYAPVKSDINISVRDVNGKLILSNDVKAQKGWNTHRLKADDFNTSGIYIYEVTSGKTTLSKRMILLNN